MVGKIYGYIRVSSQRQAESGLSLEAQTERITQEFRRLKKQESLKQGAIYRDAGVSAYRYDLCVRPEGAKLDAVLASGDHVVIAKLDRAFRSQRDAAVTISRWNARGVIVHMLDIGQHTGTPLGKMIIGILASLAEWESARRGERLREAFAALRAEGYAMTSRPLGWRIDSRSGKLVPHKQEREVAKKIAQMRRKGLSNVAIAAELTRLRVKRESGKKWTHQAVARLDQARQRRWKSKVDG